MDTEKINERRIGVVVPVGALRGSKSTGVGEYLDLIEFSALCVEMGIGLIQILPVNDTGYESSPYSALTAFALHPLYIRLDDLEEAANFRQKIAELGRRFDGERRFPYYQVLRAKMELLREMYRANAGPIARDAETGALAGWIKENPWVKAYAVFRRLKEANGEKSWKEWDKSTILSGAAGAKAAPDTAGALVETLWAKPELRDEHLFWAWLQKALDSQFSRAAKAIRDLGILLEGDLPILMNEDSCDVWVHRNIFRMDLSAGAPPDMYSPEGQNWGFPIYNWEEQAKDNYAWWKNRLKAAGKYYDAYRIDHVLGFFRIWASSRTDNSSALGRFVPYLPVKRGDLEKLGFDSGRIRWMSRPHVPTGELWDALRAGLPEPEVAMEADRAFEAALERIGGEEMWLFKDSIKGEKDILALGLHPAAAAFLVKAWQNRLFIEYENGAFFPVWYCRSSRAYASLSEPERNALETLLEKRRAASEKVWEQEGEKLLSVLVASSTMLPCAEDLGAVPDCVPKVLAKLKILGLRVIRWFRDWDRDGQPYVPFDKYPELSVCTPSVHDSSTAREWWDKEADQEHFAAFIGVPSLPKVYNPGTAKIILKAAAAAASRFRVFQIQDILDLSRMWYGPDPALDRINVPGTANEFNWTYRLPASIAALAGDNELIHSVRELANI
ncbi:MAG: 4-alpha-glucanotransferase [Treponema sp.]|jgi:4-alpha-glucanotransferase|nr:4-alpha-glucanotransferase [Treponema sp.]